jgi:Na+/proline symporter
MVAFGRVIQSLTGLDATLGICIGAGIVLAYTAAGGMWAVTLTDFLQILVLVIGLCALTPVLLHDMGGWSAIRAQVPDDRFHLYPHTGGAEAWLNYARDWLVIGLGNLAGQDLIQRSLSARSEKVAQHSALLSGALYLTVGLLPVLLGIAATVVFPRLEDPDMVMMRLGQEYLPPFALILFLGALTSALMSSADSALLAPASVIGWDIVRYFRPNAEERTILLVCRVCIPVLGLLSLYLALVHNTVYTLMVDSWSILLATLFVPLTAGIWWSGANRLGAQAGMLSGAAAWVLLLKAAPEMPADLLAVPVSALFLVAVSGATRRSCPPVPLADAGGVPIRRAPVL